MIYSVSSAVGEASTRKHQRGQRSTQTQASRTSSACKTVEMQPVVAVETALPLRVPKASTRTDVENQEHAKPLAARATALAPSPRLGKFAGSLLGGKSGPEQPDTTSGSLEDRF